MDATNLVFISLFSLFIIEAQFLQKTIGKGQLIWKANCQAVVSLNKRTNEFAFFDL